MKLLAALLLFFPALASLHAQATATASTPLTLDVEVGFSALRANAGPGVCGCFWMLGENGQLAVVSPHHVDYVFDYAHTAITNANNINHNIALSTYMVGLRYNVPLGHRFSTYAQALGGFGHTQTNYLIDINQSSVAAEGGGGLNLRLSPRFAFRVFEADYVMTEIPNAVNGRQNQLRLTSGLVYHFTRQQ
jgi:peptidoglycan-associated lipoprotein